MDFYSLSEQVLNEGTNRYSVEINFRTNMREVIEGFAKMVLGYVSAALKERGYHVKKIFDAHPYRIIISSQRWQEGEWVLVVSFNQEKSFFVISKGFYNRDRDTVSVQSSEKSDHFSAAEIYRQIFNSMATLKDEPPHHIGGLKGVKGKTGPESGSLRPVQKYKIT